MKFITPLFIAAIAVFSTSAAFAVPPCTSGSNGDCSWTCSNGEFRVTCNNPSGPDRCYVVDDSAAVCAAWCNGDEVNPQWGCINSVPYNPMDGPAAAAPVDRAPTIDDGAPEPAPTPTRDAIAPSRGR